VETSKRLIEEWLPLREINENAKMEMGFIRVPKISNLHLWLARRPTSSARALTLASVLPADKVAKEKFNDLLGLSLIGKQPYRLLYLADPDREVIKKVINELLVKDPEQIITVDPMAGGGSIPLESLRLGFKTIAIDYNPVAYLILKATLEYPAKYGEKLYDSVKTEAEALIEYAERELSRYYAEDAYNYIIARGFHCPSCGGLVPVIHRTRLRKKGPYIKFEIDREKKEFNVTVVDQETEYERLKCPFCGRPFTRDEFFSQWISKHKETLKIALKGDLEEAENYRDLISRIHLLLLKQTKKGFGPCNDRDVNKFYQAYLDLVKQARMLRQYLPSSSIPKENEVFKPIRNLGIEFWYELFNPRQTLVFLKLIKYISERTRELVNEKGEFGAAIAIYLAFGLDKLLDYNNIATMWDTIYGTIGRLGDQYAAKKSVSLGLEYCELVVPLQKKSIGWVYEPDIIRLTTTHGGICPVLFQLCKWLNGLEDRVTIYLGDARELSQIIGRRSIDLVNVDPPYFNQHFYSDLSELFWQCLILTLKPAIEAGYLFNRDKNQGRVECLISGWSPLLPTLPRKGEIIVRRGKKKLDAPEVSYTKEWWREQMWRFFSEANRTLKDEGILLVWYTHSDPLAWEAVLSGLYASKFTISKVWNMRTEARRFIARLGGSAFFTSLALIARKNGTSVIVGERNPKELLSNKQVHDTITQSVIDALQSARLSGASERETYVMALAGAIAGATRVRNPALESFELSASETLDRYVGESREEEIAKRIFNRTSKFFRESLYPVALFLGASKVLQQELLKAGLSEREMELIVAADDITKAYLVFWLSTRYIETEMPCIDYDFAEKICKVLETRVDTLKSHGLIKKAGSNMYQVLFGQEIFDAVGGKIELLDRTAVGSALSLLKLIVDSPIKDDEEKCARDVLKSRPVSKQVVATAIFLLRTAKEHELRKASITPITKPYVERVLKVLFER